MLAVESDSVIVIDCGGDVIHRLLASEIDPDKIELLVLSHEHPDHIAGFPLFMEKIWLTQRRRPIRVAGPEPALRQARALFETFDTSGWEGMPSIEWTPVPLVSDTLLFENEEWKVTAAPGVHSVPVIGVRLEDKQGGGVVAYSADTEPADSIIDLARGADILVHEATGGFPGHTRPTDAAAVAREVETSRLIMVHLAPRFTDEDLEEARQIFDAAEAGTDGARIDF